MTKGWSCVKPRQRFLGKEPLPDENLFCSRVQRGFCVQIRGVMTLRKLLVIFSPGPVHLAPANNRRAGIDLLGPGQEVLVFVNGEEFRRVIGAAKNHSAIPGEDRHVGDGVVVTGDVGAISQRLVEDVKLALGFHCEAIDGVLVLFRRIGVEMAEAAAKIRGGSHLPEQPV